MNNNVQMPPIDLNRLIKSPGNSNIWHDYEVQLPSWDVGVGFLDLGRFFFGADGGEDSVLVFEEDVEDVRGDEAAASGEKYD